MANKPNLDNYVNVAARIRTFREAHPTGSIRPYQDPRFPIEQYIAPGVRVVTMPTFTQTHKHYDETGELLAEEVEEITETYLVTTMAVYRDVNAPTPAGIASAWEPYPGKTSFTRQSELMNGETSAAGRAIWMALEATAEADRSIASAEEVAAHSGAPEPVQVSPNQRVRQLTADVLNAQRADPTERRNVILAAKVAAIEEGLGRIRGASGTFEAFLDRELQEVERDHGTEIEAAAAAIAESYSVLDDMAQGQEAHDQGDYS